MPLRGLLKKAASLRYSYGRQASGSMPAVAASRRRADFFEQTRGDFIANSFG